MISDVPPSMEFARDRRNIFCVSWPDSAASVGRLDFEKVADLEAYVSKVVTLEQEPAPVTERDAVFFARTSSRLNS